MSKLLKNLEIEEVSLVGRPAAKAARVLLFKSATRPEDPAVRRERVWGEIQRLAERRLAKSDQPTTFSQAVAAVLETEEGRALYSEYVALDLPPAS